jgi:ribonuclease T1
MSPGRRRRVGLAAVLACVLLAWALSACGSSHGSGSGTLTTVAQTSLPPQAQETLALIDRGGPFPYDEDGIVFENREGILPQEKYGYYHEYTVRDPRYSDRGPWRIVTGSSGEYYWTHDHYASFERITR